MTSDKTIVSVTGYGSTGSSAVVDFLKSQSEVEVADDFEFQAHYFPDTIRDLDYKLNEVCARHYDSDLAIVRFLDVFKKLEKWYEPAFHGKLYGLAEEYIDSLNPIKWSGYWAYDRLNFSSEQMAAIDKENEKIAKKRYYIHQFNRVRRKIGLPLITEPVDKAYFTPRTMYLCSRPDDFILKTQNFTSRLLDFVAKTDKNILVVNMLLPPNCPQYYNKYFANPVKSIVVSKDPRDLFVQKNITKWKVVPYEDVDTFIKWYDALMRDEVNEKDKSVLNIKFEDLIYEFESTAKRICDFLGLDNSNIASEDFDPHVSVINTQVWKRYPEYNAQVAKIESELKKYLYDFNNHKEVAYTGTTGKAF